MHEMSLMRDLLTKISSLSAQHENRRVTTVRVWLGALSHISKDHFIEHFVEAAPGTVAEGAVIEVTTSQDLNDPRAQDILLESVDLE